MSYPILYPADETAFESNGFGILSDATECLVTEERNGSFELEMSYPMKGIHFEHLALRCILMVKPNPTDPAQPFRIYDISRPMGGIVTVSAQHLSYDLSGYPAMPFTAANAPAAMAALKNNAVVEHPFTFWTNLSTMAEMTVTVPTSTRALLGGVDGSVIDVYGGEWYFDRYAVQLLTRRGTDRGMTIRYGKNLTDLKQEENCANVYTAILPYWKNSDGNLVTLPEKIVAAQGTYDFVRIQPVDLSSEFKEPPAAGQLRERAEQYVKENDIGVPRVSIDVSFVQMSQSPEYKDLALLERVDLGDTVTVEFPAMGVSATARVNTTVYDAILERYENIKLGDVKSTLADTILQQSTDTRREISTVRGVLERDINVQNQWLTDGQGSYALTRDADGKLQGIAGTLRITGAGGGAGGELYVDAIHYKTLIQEE